MPTPQLALPQQFGRFLLTGALVFTIVLWLTSSILVSTLDAHRDLLVIRFLSTECTGQSFAACWRDFETAAAPFFLRQRLLVISYLISFSVAWLAAFLYDSKILRKENLI